MPRGATLLLALASIRHSTSMDLYVLYVVGIILTALIFDFYNGMNDAANSIATVVATRVLTPRLAVLWAAFFNFVAAFFFKTHVAATIGTGLIAPHVVSPHLVFSTLLAAIAWTAICTHLGLPISVSHALIGGLAGTAMVEGGLAALAWSKLGVIAIFIVLSPLIGLFFASAITVATMWICRKKTPQRVDSAFRVLQLLSAAVYSLSHGLNDAQKTMGIIFALLLSVPSLSQYAYRHPPPAVARVQSADPRGVPVQSGKDGSPSDSTQANDYLAPQTSVAPGGTPKLAWWIILSCQGAIAFGTYAGGWKVIRTLGHRVTKLRPFDGFSAEAGGGATIIAMSIFGIPVSTTHTITGAIFGVGIMRRFKSVRWGVGRDIVMAWILTLPASGLLAAGVYALMRFVFLR